LSYTRSAVSPKPGGSESFPPICTPAYGGLLRRRIFQPAILFVILSVILGTAVLAIVPPLRAPDENAHFVRAYGLIQGDIIPRQTDQRGRKGILMPARLHAEFSYFDAARERAAQQSVDYRHVFSQFAESPPRSGAGAVFTPYQGSEAYSPIAYIPYALAAAIAEATGASWLAMLYLMRFLGMLLTTALVALAIARTPVLPWGFFAVAMLPSSLYGRSVVSADGPVLASSLILIALCLRGAVGASSSATQRSLWFALTAMTKPSQLSFVMMEAMTRPLRAGLRNWLSVAAVILPAVVLCLAWVLSTGGDIAAWRLYEDPAAREQFEIGWKLKFMLAHPLHFPSAVLTSLDYSGELWRQLIGVLGWIDTRLIAAAYPLLSGLLALATLDQLHAPAEIRWRIAFVSGLTLLAYTGLVFLLFFITSTPIDADRVHGLQGRYFVVLVPVVGLLIAALVRRRPPVGLAAGAAVLLALISGLAVVEAVLRKDWS
jgi:uncharacterized membrane protein